MWNADQSFKLKIEGIVRSKDGAYFIGCQWRSFKDFEAIRLDKKCVRSISLFQISTRSSGKEALDALGSYELLLGRRR